VIELFRSVTHSTRPPPDRADRLTLEKELPSGKSGCFTMSLEAKNRSVPSTLVSARRQSGWATDQFWDRLAPVAFCLFMASLITLLVLTYSGVPIV
jgi:hypothetical protein